jgi:hypothetical protein
MLHLMTHLLFNQLNENFNFKKIYYITILYEIKYQN